MATLSLCLAHRSGEAHRVPPRRIAIVAFEDVQVLDVTGPLEVFGRTSRWLIDNGCRPDPAYDLELVACHSGTISTSSGLRLVADRAYADLEEGIDTLLVAGGRGARAAASDQALIDSLRRIAPRVRRLGSVCTGAFILAAAGLLDGRKATTHWSYVEELQRRYPSVRVEADPIYVRDDQIYTSAGVTAGMDLALALVEEDHGPQVALQVARQLVLFLRRPGGQSQFSTHLAVQMCDRDPLRELQQWMGDHLDSDLAVEALADRVAMSPRHFARVFATQAGMTPARFVARLRVEAARRRLEESADSTDVIARTCGFGTREAMRRAFIRAVGVPPSDYRNRFSAEAVS